MLHLIKGFLGNTGNERFVARTWPYHALASGHMVMFACGHMHGRHATTVSTQGKNILGENRSFIGRGGEAGDRL
jgi:predicted oxidoreductase